MKWPCGSCTFLNAPIMDQCEMCSAKRGMDIVSDVDGAQAVLFQDIESLHDQSSFHDHDESKEFDDYNRVNDSAPARGGALDDDDEFSRDFARQQSQHNDLLASLMVAIIQKSSKPALQACLDKEVGINSIDEELAHSPLSLAVERNFVTVARNLIDLRADVNLTVNGESPLSRAVANGSYDGTEMARMLLSKGADEASLLKSCIVEPSMIENNLCLSYWLNRAKKFPKDQRRKQKLRNFDLEKVDELEFGIIGEEPALRMVIGAVQTHYFDLGAANGKPLVIFLPGPPGHGKTYLTRNLARALGGEDNYLEIACGTIRDDANLFGSNLGGFGGKNSSDGQITAFLRTRQNQISVIFLDEFEKIKELTNALGWDQAKKIYQAFLEPWQEGTLTDYGAQGGGIKLKCDKTIFICTTNLGQEEILDFARRNQGRCYGTMTEDDIAWVQKELVAKELVGKKEKRGVFLQFFCGINPQLQALVRRIDCIAPFLPLAQQERQVVSDNELRAILGRYRDPPIMEGELSEKRMLGNLVVHHDVDVCKHVAEHYNEMEGASSLQKCVKTIIAKLNRLGINNGLEKAPVRAFGPSQHMKQEVWLAVNEEDDDVKILFQKPEPKQEKSKTEAKDRDGAAATAPTGANYLKALVSPTSPASPELSDREKLRMLSRVRK